MDSGSKGVVEASSGRTCQTADRQVQKGTVPGYAVKRCIVSTRMEPGVKHRPKVTQNGHTERGNPSVALQSTGAGNHPQAPMGGMAQEANAWGNAQDMLTWGGCQGR